MPWCPKHRWEFTWSGTKVCPSCGSELVDEPPPGAQGIDAQFVPPESETVTAARLGSFDRLAAPVLLDLLTERGIRAFEAPPLADPATRAWNPVGVDVWVDKARLDEARAIAANELPAVLGSAALTVAPEDEFVEEGEVEVESELGDEELEDAITWSSFGWMELDPARVFLQLCDDEGITVRTEYPLDGPPPPWAQGVGRVHVEVEDIFVDAAEELLATLEKRLDAQGIAWSDPLCDLSGP